MKRKVDALLRLIRYREFIWFVIVTTLLGAGAANGDWGWRLAGILVANWLAVAFAFMINDVEDAPEDALDPAKVKRNPVSAADLSARAARIASFSAALLAVFTYALIGFWPFITGISCLILGFLYSWRRVRLKTIPFIDMLAHCLMLAGLQFLAAYFTFEPSDPGRWLFPFLFITAISLYGELFNELRDLEGDRNAGITHTATLLGARATHWLMLGILAAGVGSALAMVFLVRLFPTWVLLLLVVLAGFLILPALLRVRRSMTSIELQQSFQKPLEVAGAVSLLAQFFGAWAITLLKF